MDQIPMHVIAHIHTDFPTKFGIPRQSGLVDGLKSTLVFQPEYRNPDALRGIEGFSHLWLIWQFSQAVRTDWSPTVRPPRLGGNTRMGVFATRSPFRPNAIGLSAVRLEGVEHTATQGTVLHLAGADLMDGTPILDVKPYLPYSDCHPEATGGFAATPSVPTLAVEYAPGLEALLSPAQRETLTAVLALDPRPSYQRKGGRDYGFEFGGFHVGFSVEGNLLTVHRLAPIRP